MEGSVENEKDETTIAERALRDGARCWDDAWCDLGIGCSDDARHGGECALSPGRRSGSRGAGFSDISADAWYADAVNWAASVGVVAGYGDAFGANDAITREQLAAILCNYAAYKGEDVSSGAALDGYSDAASVSDWAGESVEWAVAEGLLSGVTNNELAPQGSATRAQVAAMLQRFNAR